MYIFFTAFLSTGLFGRPFLLMFILQQTEFAPVLQKS